MDDAIIQQLQYELFLAEESMKLSLKRLNSRYQYVTEATEIQALNEGVLEIIKKYLKQVTASMQKAWNTFKGKIDRKAIAFMLNENNKKYLESGYRMKLPDDFEYPEINVWNDINQNCNLGDNLLTTGNYNQMSEYLETPEDFLKQYYGTYIEQENGNQMKIGDVFQKRCFSKASDQTIVDKGIISQYVEFLTNYNTQIESIQSDIDAINQVNQNIDQMLQQLGIQEFALLEADNTNKFRSADPNAEDTKNKNSKDRQHIVNYYKAMTQILSAKMKTCNKVKTGCFQVVSNYILLQGGIVKPKEGKTTATTTQRTETKVPQVNT